MLRYPVTYWFLNFSAVKNTSQIFYLTKTWQTKLQNTWHKFLPKQVGNKSWRDFRPMMTHLLCLFFFFLLNRQFLHSNRDAKPQENSLLKPTTHTDIQRAIELIIAYSSSSSISARQSHSLKSFWLSINAQRKDNQTNKHQVWNIY